QGHPRDIDHGQKTYCDNIGGSRIRVWNCPTLERRYRYGGALQRTCADLQLRAATTAPGRIRSTGSLRRLHRAGLWLGTAVRISRWPPLFLARSSPSLALIKNLSAAGVGPRPRYPLVICLLRFCFYFRKSRLLQSLIQRGKIGFE